MVGMRQLYAEVIESAPTLEERNKRRAQIVFALTPIEEAEARLSDRDCAIFEGQAKGASCPFRARFREANWGPTFLECPNHGLVPFNNTVLSREAHFPIPTKDEE